ncbi:oxidoreductase [Streptomyces antnestii]|uniref:Oxidoreductase n=1 Tax=Streptomyces antnestii TaxID=2494256 RepID=A0A3S2VF74_9ACTN|nr:PDR/VanB family oxidoreductase [Streptomyces sp. San01]RVU23267.1 oxidoreductase [Streptomyces sp. San01]
MRATGGEQPSRLRVSALVWEAEGVLSVHLARPDGAHLPAWTPGAHLDLHLPGGLVRQYSLSGSPADRTTWRITVLREPASRGGSREVHEVLRPGDVVDVSGPRNNFALPQVTTARYRFIAGGIGITPLLPMIERVASAGADWTLLYGGRSRSSMAFLAELSRHGERVVVRPQDEYGLLDLVDHLGPPTPDTSVFCCGPEPLLAAVEQVCGSWPPGTLHVERFAPKLYAAAPETDTHAEAFEVVLHRTGRTVTVPAGRSILDALEDHRIDVPNSCREGICGTCETKVIDGVPEHRDSLLSPEERAANDTMMICVGRSRGPRLTLDL